MNRIDRKMWQFPWGYKESITITVGLFIVGLLLQISLGNFNFYLLRFPINLYLGIGLFLLTVGLSFRRKGPIVTWLCSVPLSVTLIGGLLILTIFMGLIPQFARVNTDLHIHFGESSMADIANYVLLRIGFKQLTSSWPFVLIYNFTLFVLGLITAKRFHRFSWRDYGFYLNHIGLWLFLFAAGYGASDRLRYVMYVNEGEVEWRVYDANEQVLELDIAIKLHDFIMEEYPPKLAVLEKKSGDVQPVGNPAYYQIENKQDVVELAGWKFEIEDYIHEAVRKTDTTFQAIPMSGSVPAVLIKLNGAEDSPIKERWVTCGGPDQYMMPLDLDDDFALVMTKPEPKRFASDITVLIKEDNSDPIHAVLEVNRPLKIGDWTIYQYDYDHNLGKASRYSGFELVYDPWLNSVYIGIFLLAMGALSMLWSGNKKRMK